MMKNQLLLFLLLSTTIIKAQTVADFESFGLAPGDFLNQVENDTFYNGLIGLPNDYNENYDAWTGWAISATTDTLTRGFMNQYSVRSGSGVNGSTTYAVTYAFDETPIILTGNAAGAPVSGFYINNSTYAYYSMLEGDSAAKRFGGETGDDPDYFLLSIQGELNGQRTANTVEFYLADYRFADNSQDYIIKDWTYVDLQSLGNVDRLWFSLSSTDIGQFGMNTPAYFCLDDLTTSGDPVSTTDQLVPLDLRVYPNPCTEYVQIEWLESTVASVQLLGSDGLVIRRERLTTGTNTITLQDLPKGIYWLQISAADRLDYRKIIKH